MRFRVTVKNPEPVEGPHCYRQRSSDVLLWCRTNLNVGRPGEQNRTHELSKTWPGGFRTDLLRCNFREVQNRLKGC